MATAIIRMATSILVATYPYCLQLRRFRFTNANTFQQTLTQPPLHRPTLFKTTSGVLELRTLQRSCHRFVRVSMNQRPFQETRCRYTLSAMN